SSMNQHSVREIRTDNTSLASLRERKREIAGATAEIQDHGVRSIENRAQAPRSPRAPPAIELSRQQMVEQIVARRDLREHLADLAGGVRFGLRAFRKRALSGVSHFSHRTAI